MKFILLLSFILAFLPGQNVQRLHIDRTPDFVALQDQIQAIPLSEKSHKKFETQNQDFFLPSEPPAIKIAKCPAPCDPCIQTNGQTFTVPYSIRGPPATA